MEQALKFMQPRFMRGCIIFMKIFVKAKPNAKAEKVEKASENVFMVWVKEPALKGKANEAVERALAEYFGISKSSVIIISGHTSKLKIVEINK